MYQVLGNVRTRTFRVLWALHELGLEFEHMDFPAQSPEALKLNPSGKVPAMIAEGETIIDSVAIITYLADKHGDLTYPKESLRWEFARSIKNMETRMGDGPNLMGEKFTIPDIILTQCGGWARVAKFDVPEGKLRDYFKRQIKRPAYIKAMKS